MIDACEDVSLVPCPCRSRGEKQGTRECRDGNPVSCCIMAGISVPYFEAIGLGRRVGAQEAEHCFDEMHELGLVGITENCADPRHSMICLCCGCCCRILRGRTSWDNPAAFAPANFAARSNDECILCGQCAGRCLFDAIRLDEDGGRAVVDENKRAGRGVCAVGCAQKAMTGPAGKITRLRRAERPLRDGGRRWPEKTGELGPLTPRGFEKWPRRRLPSNR